MTNRDTASAPVVKSAMVSVIVVGLLGALPCFATDTAGNGGGATSRAAGFPDIRKIKERGRLIVAQAGGEAPPFSMAAGERSAGLGEAMRYPLPDGQSVVGIDIAMANAIARALGVSLDLRRDHPTSRSVIDAVSRGEADLGISQLGITSERLQKVLFSAPYASFSSSLLLRRNMLTAQGASPGEISPRSPLVRSLDQPGARVAVERPGSFEELFSIFFPHATAVPYESDAGLIRLLMAQGVDAALGDEFRFRLQTQIHPELALYFALLEIPEYQERIAVAINPEMPNLAPIADEVVRHFKTSSTEQFLAVFSSLLEPDLGTAPSLPAPPVPGAPTAVQSHPIGKNPGPPALRSEAFPLRPAGTVGLLLIALTAVWLRMSKSPSSRLHEKRAAK